MCQNINKSGNKCVRIQVIRRETSLDYAVADENMANTLRGRKISQRVFRIAAREWENKE